MIIYGQGAIRCHPYVQEEMRAATDGDLPRFDRAFFGHLGHVASNAVRALVLGLTDGRLRRAPVRSRYRRVRRSFGQLTRMSAAFALVSDLALGTLGGTLKRREKISGRLADALAWMYLASAALKQFVDDDQPERDRCYVEWVSVEALARIQTALGGVLDNLPNRPAALLVRPLIFPLGRRHRAPTDRHGSAVARELLEDRGARAALSRDIYVPPPDEPGLGRLEAALDHAVQALAVERKIRDAVRAGRLDKAPGDLLLERAHAAGVVTDAERRQVLAADEVRDEVIQVDAFDPERFRTLRG